MLLDLGSSASSQSLQGFDMTLELDRPLLRSLHVEDWGDGTPVVLLHSAGLSGRQWRRLGAISAGRMGQASVFTIPDAGHMAPLSHADQVNGIIDAGL